MARIEIAIGAGLGIIVFVILAGYNIIPVLLLIGVCALFYFLVMQKTMLNFQGNVKYKVTEKIAFADIGGQETAKQELIEALNFIIESEKTQNLGIRPLKGILLTGPPGTGKTMLAKAAAAFTDAVFLAAAGSEFVEMYAGVGAQRVRDLFKKAKELAKKESKNRAVIFIDEVEVLGGKRGSHSSHLEYDQTLNQLLVEMDGLKSTSEVKLLIIAATNRADMLDQALLRPGRFDRQVKVDLPDKEGRMQILKLHTKNKPLAEDVDLDNIAQETFGFSGAHLESLANEAAIYALRDNCSTISNRHFKEAVDKVMLGEKLDKKPTCTELERVAIHEAGHAIMCEVLRPGSVAHLTIVPRGQALGYMRQTPEGDIYLYTKSHLTKQIKIALAGAIAEEMLLGERSTGAANDFHEALKTAKQIVVSGLSDLGIVDAEKDEQLVNSKAKEIINEQLVEAKEILSGKLKALFFIVDELKLHEMITGEYLRDVLEKYSRCA